MAGGLVYSEESEEESASRPSPVKIGQRIFQESGDEQDSDEADTADIYAQMKAKLLGKTEGSTKPVAQNADSKAATKKSDTSFPVKSLAAVQKPVSSRASSASASASDSDAPVVSRKRSRQGVFVHESGSEKSSAADSVGSDSDLPEPASGDRLKELIASKRREREEREAEEQAGRREKAAAQAQLSDLFNDDEKTQNADKEDPSVDDKLTQQARPTRKASKKALEEMEKETQRMSRNMQLTHQAKVKKRFSMADFAAKFKKHQPESTKAQDAQPNTSSAAPSSDVEKEKTAETPPSSPPSEGEVPNLGKSIFAPRQLVPTADHDKEDEDLPSLEEILSQSLSKRNKGKEAVPVESAEPAAPAAAAATKPAKKRLSPRKYRIHSFAPTSSHAPSDSSDDDLEIVKDRLSVFSNVAPRKSAESAAFHNLRLLANLNANDAAFTGKGRKKNSRPSMTIGQLDAQLRAKAALQVKQEREEKIAELKAKGIIVQTAEERERDMMMIEDMLEVARREADELKKKERELAKLEGREGELEASDDESDEEWMEGGEEKDADGDDEEDEEEEMEVSGSEDEEMEDAEEEVEKVDLVDDAADEADGEEEEEEEEDEEEEQQDDQMEEAHVAPVNEQDMETPAPKQRNSRKKFVMEDDEDEEEAVVASSQPPFTDKCPSQPDDLAAAFGFGAAPKPVMSPSQMFAGTMAASQTQQSQTQEEQDSMDIFNEMVPSRPSLPTPPMNPGSQVTVMDDSLNSQVLPDTQSPQVDLDYPQNSMQSPAISRLSQVSSWPSPSQDVGLGYRDSPLANPTKAPQSTIDTVLLSIPESPVPQRRGRLQQRRTLPDEEDTNPDNSESAPAPTTNPPTAFDLLRSTKPTAPAFDKKKSAATKLVDEQASESDDEYAGLGGASDDDSAAGSGDEADKALIDDVTAANKNDERRLAAYYAAKARTENEAQTSKLYKDLMSGALRRRGGDAFDLDSDEDERAVERRRRKQVEEARKRRLLLGDERLGKLAEGRGEAFLRAIEDRDEDQEQEEEGWEGIGGSQGDVATQEGSQGTEQGTQDVMRAVSGNGTKRKAEGDEADPAPFKRPKYTARRTANAAFVKPASLAEVKESVSFLIEEPHMEERRVELSDDEGQDASAETQAQHAQQADRAPFSARRMPAKPAVVDRLLARQSSSSAGQEKTGMAFQRSNSSFSGFKVPSLLRRATTGAKSGSGAAGSMGPPALKRDGSSNASSGAVSRGSGGQKSSINYAAREAERRAVVDKVEKRRKEDVKRIAGMRRSGGALGGFIGGFE